MCTYPQAAMRGRGPDLSHEWILRYSQFSISRLGRFLYITVMVVEELNGENTQVIIPCLPIFERDISLALDEILQGHCHSHIPAEGKTFHFPIQSSLSNRIFTCTAHSHLHFFSSTS